MTSVLVVGGGLAGLRTAERLRSRGYPGALTLLSGEPWLPYDRPPLSKQVLRGEKDDTCLKEAADLDKLGITVHTGDPAVALNPRACVVATASGAEHSYDALVIACGAHPRRVPGIGGQVLRTIDDARRLRDGMAGTERMTIIGAGLIGCEVAAVARGLGVEVDLVDVESGPMTRVVGPVVAERIARLHAENGVRLHMNTRVHRESSGELRVSDGTALTGGLVLEAVGSTPTVEWLATSGVPLDDGVVCDRSGRVSEGIYAVGDVARWSGVRHEHWDSCTVRADHVAAAILGQDAPAEEVAYWWSDQYDLKIQGLGMPGRDDEVHLVDWGPKQRLVALYSRDGVLTGAVGFSAAGAIARLRRDIATGAPVSAVVARLRG